MIKLKSIIQEMLKQGTELEILCDLKELELELKRKYPQLENLSLTLRSSSNIHIESIKVKKEYRGQKIGAEVIKKICQFADDHGKYITLHPAPQPRYKKKLYDFYKNLGFRFNLGRKMLHQYSHPFHITMIRDPKKTDFFREVDKKYPVAGNVVDIRRQS